MIHGAIGREAPSVGLFERPDRKYGGQANLSDRMASSVQPVHRQLNRDVHSIVQ